jgi:hypothetical protein
MPWSFIIPAAVSLLGAKSQSDAASKAARTSADATNQATQLQREQWLQQQKNQEPWLQAGGRALGKLEAASDYTPFGMSQFTQDPGYAFRMKQGMNALNNQAAARGGLISGNALKAAQGYGQEMGSQEYMNAFNRYQTERNARLNPLQSLAGVGQTAANTLGQSGQNYATNVGNALTNQAAIAGNAGMAGANAYGNALSGIGSAYGKNPINWGNLSSGSSSSSGANPAGYGTGYDADVYW